MVSDDEYLERIVAGIQAATSDGADVKWNETLNGRQFDVTVRFQLGTLRYLVLVEVKNRSRRASAADIEAFVTKARDQKANKAVFVTAAGFQEGAIGVAKRHGVDLFTVQFDETDAEFSSQASYLVRHMRDLQPGEVPEIKLGAPEPIFAIEQAVLRYEGGATFELPSESSQMSYYVERTDTSDGRKLSQLMQPTDPPVLAVGEEVQLEIEIIPPVGLFPPDDYYFPIGTLKSITITLAMRMGRSLSGNVRVEPTSVRSPVVYRNVLTGEETRFSLDQLPLNTEPPVPGKFYVLPHPMRYYHCMEIKGHLVTWELIESFQNENLLRTTYTQRLKYASYYIPISDKKTIQRLERRLADFRTLKGQ